jgi:hypothetical protein
VISGVVMATADFSTAAAKCAAFGRIDVFWVMRREQATATADFSAAAASAPPSVEMTFLGL